MLRFFWVLKVFNRIFQGLEPKDKGSEKKKKTKLITMNSVWISGLSTRTNGEII